MSWEKFDAARAAMKSGVHALFGGGGSKEDHAKASAATTKANAASKASKASHGPAPSSHTKAAAAHSKAAEAHTKAGNTHEADHHKDQASRHTTQAQLAGGPRANFSKKSAEGKKAVPAAVSKALGIVTKKEPAQKETRASQKKREMAAYKDIQKQVADGHIKVKSSATTTVHTPAANKSIMDRIDKGASVPIKPGDQFADKTSSSVKKQDEKAMYNHQAQQDLAAGHAAAYVAAHTSGNTSLGASAHERAAGVHGDAAKNYEFAARRIPEAKARAEFHRAREAEHLRMRDEYAHFAKESQTHGDARAMAMHPGSAARIQAHASKTYDERKAEATYK